MSLADLKNDISYLCFLYERNTPLKFPGSCCYDTNHKNWSIKAGLEIVSFIKIRYESEAIKTLEGILQNKTLSGVEIRQQKLNHYSLLGIKIGLNILKREVNNDK